MKKFIAISVVLCALVAAGAIAVDRGPNLPQWLPGGLFVHPASVALAAGNKVTRMLGGSATIDFASTTTTCGDSSAITVTGAQVNDACSVGVPASGGSSNGSYSCFVSAANAVKVRHCAAGTADDPASALFYVRVISSQ